jgi:Cd2+/Zn2+-exporting ATPase
LKAAFLVLAVTGVATLWMAVLADTGATVIVVANALRLLRAPMPCDLKRSASRRTRRWTADLQRRE